jgi:hypothetical protein
MITNVMPSATIARNELWMAMFCRLPTVANESNENEATSTTSASTTTEPRRCVSAATRSRRVALPFEPLTAALVRLSVALLITTYPPWSAAGTRRPR